MLALAAATTVPARAASPAPVGADHAMVVSAHRLASQVGAAARHDFARTDGEAALLRFGPEAFAADPAGAAIFAKAGKPLETGDRLRQLQLAATLEVLSRDGPAAMYGGPIGAAIVAASDAG